MPTGFNLRLGGHRSRDDNPQTPNPSSSSQPPAVTPDRSATQRSSVFGHSSRASLGLDSSSASASNDKKTIAALEQQVRKLGSENDALRERVKALENSSNKDLLAEINKLRSQLKEERAAATKFRQLDATAHPLKADTEAETLFNVCNQTWLNAYFSMQDPRVISTKGADYLAPEQLATALAKIKEATGQDIDAGAGDTIPLAAVKAALTERGKAALTQENLTQEEKYALTLTGRDALKKEQKAALMEKALQRGIDKIFPQNIQMTKLSHDVRDGDKNIAIEHFECFASMIQFCSDEKNGPNDQRSVEERIEDNSPYIAPDNTTASRYSFHSSARAKNGNASLDQGGTLKFGVHEITPNKILTRLAKEYIEVCKQTNMPAQTIRRRETFNSQVNYQDRRDAALAAFELNSQGFGTHQTQMCMIIDKDSLRTGHYQDIENAGRIARKVANLSLELDDDKKLQIFSHAKGKAESLDMRIPGNDLKIMQSIQKNGAVPTAVDHVYALMEEYFPGDIERHPEYRNKPVFCTLVTGSLSNEKYEMLRTTMSLFASMGLPIFLKLININRAPTPEEIQLMEDLDNKENLDAGDDDFDNIDVIHAYDPNEITPKAYLHEYAGFVTESVDKGMLIREQGFDLSKVNIHAEGRKTNLM